MASDEVVLAEVAVGSVIDVRVPMVTPEAPAKYIGYWCVATADGFKFGHRIWVELTVQAVVAAASTAPTAPTAPVKQETAYGSPLRPVCAGGRPMPPPPPTDRCGSWRAPMHQFRAQFCGRCAAASGRSYAEQTCGGAVEHSRGDVELREADASLQLEQLAGLAALLEGFDLASL